MRRRDCVVLGAGGHAKVATECLEDSGYNVRAYFADDAQPGQSIVGDQVLELRGFKDFCRNNGIDSAFPAIGASWLREKWFNEIKGAALSIPVAIHRSSIVMLPGDEISDGTVVMPMAVVEPCTRIGRGCIINTGASVAHDSRVGSFTHIAPGARIGGGCEIGTHCLIGINACVNAHLRVGHRRTVPSGKAVIANIPDAPRKE